MIESLPSTTFTAYAEWGAAPADPLEVSILEPDGTVLYGPSDDGVAPLYSGATDFSVSLTAPHDEGYFRVRWEDGGGVFAEETLQVAIGAAAQVTTQQTTSYDVGDFARLTATFVDDADAPSDPSAVVFKARQPDGTQITYTYGDDVEVVRVSEGVFRVDLPLTDAGVWSYQFASTGTGQAVEEGQFLVAETAINAEPEGYTTVEDLLYALAPGGQDTRSGDTAASLERTQLEDAITEASQEIDLRLAQRYTVPFEPVPPIIAQLTRDIAAYGATLTHRRGNPLGQDHPIRLRYTKATGLLDKIADGTIELDEAEGVARDSGEAFVVNPYEGNLWDLDSFDLGPSYNVGSWPNAWDAR